MNGQSHGTTAVRVGAVGAYLGRADLETVREMRRMVGRVTLSGKIGRKLVNALADAGDDLSGIDYDPAAYLSSHTPEADLFTEFDSFDPVISWQRDRGLRTVRSPGKFVRGGDHVALRAALGEPLEPDVVRVVSLDSSWFRDDRLAAVIDAAQASVHQLALVLAGVFDPLSSPALVNGWRTFHRAMRDGGPVVEWLRTDVMGIGFAAEDGAFSAIGLTTSGRHHGMPLPSKQREAYEERQRYPQVFVPGLLSWQRGSQLGALTDFGGAGLTDCPCNPCAGRSLLRFDRQWPSQVPDEVRRDAAAHDVAAWSEVARRVLASQDPAAAWVMQCRNAVQNAAFIASTCKVSLKVPPSISAWA